MTISGDKIIGISCLHGCAMLFMTSLLRNAELYSGEFSGAFLIMLVISAMIMPGALLAWKCREGLSVWKWLMMVIPYWLVVTAISALGAFLMRKGVEIKWPVFGCAAVAILVLIFASSETKRLAAKRRNSLRENHNA